VDASESTYPHKIVQIKHKIVFKFLKLLKKIHDHWKVVRSLERKSLTEGEGD
jgi:hypothetical protein